MTATVALLLDSVRLLMARKLFVITLGISALLVLIYSMIGFDENGLSLAWGLFHIESDIWVKDSPGARTMLLGIFSTFIASIWLAWGATILGLISTATILPDFLSAGSIDLVLSKPISRVQLFLVKYAGALFFMIAQISLFCVGVFFVLGLRLGEWNFGVFAAIPLITALFSFIYCISALVAVLTRSSIAALLFALLFWFGLWIVQSTEQVLNAIATQQQVTAERSEARIESLEAAIVRRQEALEKAENPESLVETIASNPRRIESLKNQIEADRTRIVRLEQEAASAQNLGAALDRWHGAINGVLLVLPKTQQTLQLLDRAMDVDLQSEIENSMFNAQLEVAETGEFEDGAQTRMMPTVEQIETERAAAERIRDDYQSRSAFVTIGSSLAFEVVILGIACFIFVRRDF